MAEPIVAARTQQVRREGSVLPRRRRRRRVGRWVRLAIFLSVVVTGSAMTIPALFAETPSVRVNDHRVAIKSKAFTVADAARAADVDLKPGAIYSAGTHTVLGYDGPLPELRLNGLPARSDSVV